MVSIKGGSPEGKGLQIEEVCRPSLVVGEERPRERQPYCKPSPARARGKALKEGQHREKCTETARRLRRRSEMLTIGLLDWSSREWEGSGFLHWKMWRGNP